MAAILISVGVINCENLACNKRGVHIWGGEIDTFAGTEAQQRLGVRIRSVVRRETISATTNIRVRQNITNSEKLGLCPHFYLFNNAPPTQTNQCAWALFLCLGRSDCQWETAAA